MRGALWQVVNVGPYSQILAAAHGAPPYSNWRVTAGALPPGLNLDASSGAISGTPTAASDLAFRFSVTVQDSAGATSQTQPLSIAIGITPPTITTLYAFCQDSECTDGSGPNAVVQARDGNFYGTTAGGGTYGYGTVFRLTPGGALTTLYNFCAGGAPCTDGAVPQAALVQGKDGNFYGTTSEYGSGTLSTDCGSAFCDGTIFKITPAGTLTTLYSFCSQGGSKCTDGGYPPPGAALAQGTDGDFYGTTFSGGLNHEGTVFKITPGGTLTTLYNFCSVPGDFGIGCADGNGPNAGLVLATDGNFYGTTADGGGDGVEGGTFFKMTPDGRLTTLYTFCSINCAGGVNPSAALIQAANGNFYGTTPSSAGDDGNGVVFEVTPAGALTTLYTFFCSNNYCPSGFDPSAPLVQATNANLYGTTATTIFQITPSGKLNTLYQCGCGDSSMSALVQATDGNFYGGSSQGAAGGVIFRMSLAPTLVAPAIGPGGVVSASAFGEFPAVAPGSWIEIYGSNLAAETRSWMGSDFNGIYAPTALDGTSVTVAGQPASVSFISSGQVNVQVPTNIPTGTQPLILSTSAGAGNTYMVTVNPTEPGLLAPTSFNVGGSQYAAALFPDYSTFAIPTGAIAGVPSRPAQPGDTLILYGIGFGEVSPSIPGGELVKELNSLALPLHIYFGGVEAQVNYEGLAPNFVGLYQINVVVPEVPPGDLVPLTITLGGNTGVQTLYVAVQGVQ